MDKNERVCGAEEKGSRFFFGRVYNKIIAFLLSLIYMSRVGRFFVQDDKSCDDSHICRIVQKKHLGRSSKVFTAINIFFSKSKVAGFFKKLTSVILSMSISVYGVFFMAYGIAATFARYALMFIEKGDSDIILELGIPIAIVLLSVPLLISQKSITEIASSSMFIGKFVRFFLMIPEEKLITKKRIGSSELKVLIATIGVIIGAVTYFVPTLTVPFVFLAFILLLVIMSHPESGVMLIAVTVPFLQYTKELQFIFPILVCVTCVSYFFKVWSGKRVGVHSTEGIVLSFFCIFMILASSFTAGGWQTFTDGIHAVIMVIGGFYITYNLMRNEKKLDTCLKALIVSFGILVFMGAFDMVLSVVEDTIKFSQSGISYLISEKIFYIADSASNFGIIACLVSPMLFCHACAKKSISGITLSLVGFCAAIAMSFIYGTYESLLAIGIGLLIYCIFHSRKSFATLLIIFVIACIAISLVFSFVPENLTDKAMDLFEGFRPVNHPDVSIREELDEGVWSMLKNGHLHGIGVGERAFSEAFSPYSTQATDGASSAANLYMQIICWSGIGGLVAFCLFFAWVFKGAIGYIIVCTDKKIRRIVVALGCGLATALMLGSVTNLWEDMRIFYMFWMMTALLCGYVRLGRVRDERKLIGWTSEPDRIDVNVKFH